MNSYSLGNPPPVKVGDLLFLNLPDEGGFGIIIDLYEARYKGKMTKMMKVYWPTRLNVFQDHDINLVAWSTLIQYHGNQ
jgi:hypothetical protein